MYPVAEKNRQAIFFGPIHVRNGKRTERRERDGRRDDPEEFNGDGETTAGDYYIITRKGIALPS